MGGKTIASEYGNTLLLRGYCKECGTTAIILDGKLQCCDKTYTKEASKYFLRRKEVPALNHRKTLPPGKIKKKLEEQENKCIYCGIHFGEPYYRKGKVRFTEVHWDHFTPFTYSQNNKKNNFVAACSICNQLKSNKIFLDVDDARKYILYMRNKKGYEFST